MVQDPWSWKLLLGVLADVAAEGIPRIFAHLDRRYATTEHDVSGGAPVTTRLRLTFSTTVATRPHWVLLAMQSRDGSRVELPALYGDPLEIVVRREWYDFLALFLSKPLSFHDKPVLLALGAAHEGAIGARQQQMPLFGRYPSPELVNWLDSRVPPANRPFRLPVRLPAMLSPNPAAGTVGRPASPISDELRRMLDARRQLGPARGSAAPTQQPAFPVPLSRRPTIPPAPPPTPRAPAGRPSPPPHPRPPSHPPPPDGQCQARTRRGNRCQNWSEGARGNVCDMHLDMVSQGKTVLWHANGQPIRLRKK